MKTTLSIWNYAQQNTPKIAHKIGNYMLTLSLIGTAILMLPTGFVEVGVDFQLPEWLSNIAKGMAACGVIVKVFTKMLGTNDGPKPADSTSDSHVN